jgi:hypothetical protein
MSGDHACMLLVASVVANKEVELTFFFWGIASLDVTGGLELFVEDL